VQPRSTPADRTVTTAGHPDREQGPDTLSEWRVPEFERRWRVRQRTTRLEQTLITQLLGDFDTRRLVELGTGPGRLSPTFRASATEYVGVDLNREFLERARDALRKDGKDVFVRANLLHLPFVRGGVTAACLVRVYNHLVRPHAALREIARVLTPGGRFVATIAVRPTAGTVQLDLQAGLARRTGIPFRGLTLGRAPVVEHRTGRIVTFHPTQAELEAELQRAGVQLHEVYGAGINDLWLLRRVPFPVGALLGAGRRHPKSFLFTQRWVVGAWGPRQDLPLPSLNEIFACPRCARPLGPVDLRSDWTVACADCAFPIEYKDSILEAVWGPDSPRSGPSAAT
jgi:ubiquinone/menaquinone biosynthesis C-methylase UbiE